MAARGAAEAKRSKEKPRPEPEYSLFAQPRSIRPEFRSVQAEFTLRQKEQQTGSGVRAQSVAAPSGGSAQKAPVILDVSKLLRRTRPPSGGSMTQQPQQQQQSPRSTNAAPTTTTRTHAPPPSATVRPGAPSRTSAQPQLPTALSALHPTARLVSASTASATELKALQIAETDTAASDLTFGHFRPPVDRSHADLRLSAQEIAFNTAWDAVQAFHGAVLTLLRPTRAAATATLRAASSRRSRSLTSRERLQYASRSRSRSRSGSPSRIAGRGGAVEGSGGGVAIAASPEACHTPRSQLSMIAARRAARVSGDVATQALGSKSSGASRLRGNTRGPAHCPLRTLRYYTEPQAWMGEGQQLEHGYSDAVIHRARPGSGKQAGGGLAAVVGYASAVNSSHAAAAATYTPLNARRQRAQSQTPASRQVRGDMDSSSSGLGRSGDSGSSGGAGACAPVRHDYVSPVNDEVGDLFSGGDYLPNLWAALSWYQRRKHGPAAAAAQLPASADVLDRATFVAAVLDALKPLVLPFLRTEVARMAQLATLPRSMSEFDRAYQRYRNVWQAAQTQQQLQLDQDGSEFDEDGLAEGEEAGSGAVLAAVTLPAAEAWLPSSIRGTAPDDPRFDPLARREQEAAQAAAAERKWRDASIPLSYASGTGLSRGSAIASRASSDDGAAASTAAGAGTVVAREEDIAAAAAEAVAAQAVITGGSNDGGSVAGVGGGRPPSAMTFSLSGSARQTASRGSRSRTPISAAAKARAAAREAGAREFEAAVEAAWRACSTPVKDAAEELAAQWSLAHPVFQANSRGVLQQAGIEWRHVLAALRVMAEPLAMPHQHLRWGVRLCLVPLRATAAEALAAPPAPAAFVDSAVRAATFPSDGLYGAALGAQQARTQQLQLLPCHPVRVHWPAIEEEAATAAAAAAAASPALPPAPAIAGASGAPLLSGHRTASQAPCTWVPPQKTAEEALATARESHFTDVDEDDVAEHAAAASVRPGEQRCGTPGQRMRVEDLGRLLSSLCSTLPVSGEAQQLVATAHKFLQEERADAAGRSRWAAMTAAAAAASPDAAASQDSVASLYTAEDIDALLCTPVLASLLLPAQSTHGSGGELRRYGTLVPAELQLPFGPPGHLASARRRFAEHAGVVVAEWLRARNVGRAIVAAWRLFRTQSLLMKRVINTWRGAQMRIKGTPALMLWARVVREDKAARCIQRLYWKARLDNTRRMLRGVRMIQRAWRRYVRVVLWPRWTAAAKLAALEVLRPALQGWMVRRRMAALVTAQWRTVNALRERKEAQRRGYQMVQVASIITRAARRFLARQALRRQAADRRAERSAAQQRAALAAARAARQSVDARLERAAARRRLWLQQLRSAVGEARAAAVTARAASALQNAARIRSDVEALSARLVSERARISEEYARLEGDALDARPVRASVLRQVVQAFLIDLLTRGATLGAGTSSLAATSNSSSASAAAAAATGIAGGEEGGLVEAAKIAGGMLLSRLRGGNAETAAAAAATAAAASALSDAGAGSAALHEAADILRFHSDVVDPDWAALVTAKQTGWDRVHERSKDALSHAARRRGLLTEVATRHGVVTKLLGARPTPAAVTAAATPATPHSSAPSSAGTEAVSSSNSNASRARGRRGSSMAPNTTGAGDGNGEGPATTQHHDRRGSRRGSAGAPPLVDDAEGVGTACSAGEPPSEGARNSRGGGGVFASLIKRLAPGKRRSGSVDSSGAGTLAERRHSRPGGGNDGTPLEASESSASSRPVPPSRPTPSRRSVRHVDGGPATPAAPISAAASRRFLPPSINPDAPLEATMVSTDSSAASTPTAAAAAAGGGAAMTPGGSEGAPSPAGSVQHGLAASLETLGLHDRDRRRSFALAAYAVGAGGGGGGRRGSVALASSAGGSAGSMGLYTDAATAVGSAGSAASLGSGVYPQPQLALRRSSAPSAASGIFFNGGGRSPTGSSNTGGGGIATGSFINPFTLSSADAAALHSVASAGSMLSLGAGGGGGSALLRTGSAASLLAVAAAAQGSDGGKDGRGGRDEDKLTALAAGVLAYTAACITSTEKAAADAAKKAAAAAAAALPPRRRPSGASTTTNKKHGGGDGNSGEGEDEEDEDTDGTEEDDARRRRRARNDEEEGEPPPPCPSEQDLELVIRRLLSRSAFLRAAAASAASWVAKRTEVIRRRLALMSFATFDVDKRAPTLEGEARCRALQEWLAATADAVRDAVIEALDVCDLDRAQAKACRVHLAVESHLAGMRVPFEEAAARRMQQAWLMSCARAAARRRVLKVYVRVAAPEFDSYYVFNQRLGTSHWSVPWYAERMGVRPEMLRQLNVQEESEAETPQAPPAEAAEAASAVCDEA